MNKFSKTLNNYDNIPKDLLPSNNFKIKNSLKFAINEFIPKIFYFFIYDDKNNLLEPYYRKTLKAIKEKSPSQINENKLNMLIMKIIKDIQEGNGNLQKIYGLMGDENFKITVAVGITQKKLNMAVYLHVKYPAPKELINHIEKIDLYNKIYSKVRRYETVKILEIFNKDDFLSEKYYKEGFAVHYRLNAVNDVYDEYKIYLNSVDDYISKIIETNNKGKMGDFLFSVSKNNTSVIFMPLFLPLPKLDIVRLKNLKDLVLSCAKMYDKI